VLAEVAKVIMLPTFDGTSAVFDQKRVEISKAVVEQLRDFVSSIASSYRYNHHPFHNFDRACHVTTTMAV
jgi:hypothetical protein